MGDPAAVAEGGESVVAGDPEDAIAGDGDLKAVAGRDGGIERIGVETIAVVAEEGSLGGEEKEGPVGVGGEGGDGDGGERMNPEAMRIGVEISHGESSEK